MRKCDRQRAFSRHTIWPNSVIIHVEPERPVDEAAWLADRFNEHRPLLRGVAARARGLREARGGEGGLGLDG